MLKLLKIVDKVEKPVMINEAVSLNISANGDSPDDITAILGKLVNLSNPSTPTSTQDMTPHGGHKDIMMKTIADVDGYADGAAHEYADEMGEEYANEPDPEVSDVEYMTKDLAGGLNKPKSQFKKEYPGDNPMTMEEARAVELMREYKAIKEGRVDELGPKTLGSYINKSAASLGKASYKAGSTDGTAAKLDPHIHTINKRTTGIKRATDKLTREDVHAARAAHEKSKELTQQGHDAERMGDEKAMRRKFADAALEKVKAKQSMKSNKVDEISDKTALSYAKKVGPSQDSLDVTTDTGHRKFNNRQKGHALALDKMHQPHRRLIAKVGTTDANAKDAAYKKSIR